MFAESRLLNEMFAESRLPNEMFAESRLLNEKRHLTWLSATYAQSELSACRRVKTFWRRLFSSHHCTVALVHYVQMVFF